MSIPFEQKYKIFLIYFSGTKWQNCAVHICTVSDTLHALQRPAPLRSAQRGRSGIVCRPVQRVQRPGVCVVPCVVCPAACAVQSVRVRCGWQGSPAGYTAATQPRPVSSAKNLQNKKGVSLSCPPPLFCAKHPTPIVNFKNFPQKQKDPYKGSTFCAILSLQALKGRNLQWLKVK